MEPEEDFLTWNFIFTSNIQEKNDLDIFLPSFIRLIKNIRKDSKLPEKLESFTDIFLHEHLPPIIRSILNIGSVHSSDQALITKVIFQFIKLLSWAFIKDENNLLNVLVGIFERSNSFFENNFMSYNNTYNEKEKFVDVFLKDSNFSILLSKFDN